VGHAGWGPIPTRLVAVASALTCIVLPQVVLNARVHRRRRPTK
jgi:hypothetical protein